MVLKYRPLDFSKFETRILHIETITDNNSDNSQVVCCRLEVISIIEPPEFHALSYCWGDPSVTAPVVVDGQIVQITTNLNDALQELRRRRVRTVWVDVICINQEDLYERSQQVLQMGNVYASASRVYAWLGPYLPEWRDDVLGALHHHQLVDLAPSVMQSIFQRPFWRRVWIIQEMAKAREVDLMIGEDNLAWDEMVHLSREATNFNVISADQLELLFFLDDFRRRERSGEALPLAKALVRSKSSLASDPRDKIYALLGLVSDSARVVPLPNYMQPAAKVVQQIVHRFLVDQKRTPVLLLAPRCGNSASSSYGLPSWRPNLLDIAKDLPPWTSASMEAKVVARDVDINITQDVLTIPCKIHGRIAMIMSMHTEDPMQTQTNDISDNGVWNSQLDGLVREIFRALTWYAVKPPLMASRGSRFLSKLDEKYGVSYQPGLEETPLARSDIDEKLMILIFIRLCLAKDGVRPPEALRRWMLCNGGLKIGFWTLKERLTRYYDLDWLTRLAWRLKDIKSASIDALSRLVESGLQRFDDYSMRLAIFRDSNNARTPCSVRAVYQETRLRDRVCLLPNCTFPVILRKEGEHYKFIGEMYYNLEDKKLRAHSGPEKSDKRVTLC